MFAHDSYLSAILDKIDDMDYNTKNTDAVKVLKGEISLNEDVKPLEVDIELKAKTNKNNESASADEKPNIDYMCSNKQGQLNAEGNSAATSVMSDTEYFSYYDDARANLDFFVEHINPYEFGIMDEIVFGISALFSCCYHWEKIRNMHSRPDGKKQFFTANQSCFFTRNSCSGAYVKPCQFQSPFQNSRHSQSRGSFPVMMPADNIPKFVAYPSPPGFATQSVGDLASSQKSPSKESI